MGARSTARRRPRSYAIRRCSLLSPAQSGSKSTSELQVNNHPLSGACKRQRQAEEIQREAHWNTGTLLPLKAWQPRSLVDRSRDHTVIWMLIYPFRALLVCTQLEGVFIEPKRLKFTATGAWDDRAYGEITSSSIGPPRLISSATYVVVICLLLPVDYSPMPISIVVTVGFAS
jgi:hypothetical protein